MNKAVPMLVVSLCVVGCDNDDTSTQNVLNDQQIDGLVAYYPFNGNANDESGNGNDGDIYEAFLVADKDGNADSAYFFDGTTSYLDTKLDRSEFAEFSMCAWFKYQGEIADGFQTLFSGESNDFWVGKDVGNSNIGVQEGRYVPDVATDTNAWDGQWHHICYTNNEGAVAIYLDTAMVGDDTVGQGTGTIWIGRENEGTGFVFNGVIDEVRIYSKSLTLGEVDAIVGDDNLSNMASEGSLSQAEIDRLVGVWIGPVDQPSSSIEYSAMLTFSQTEDGLLEGVINYPELACDTTLEFLGEEGGYLAFRETVVTNLTACVNQGTISVRLDSNDSMEWLYRMPGATNVAARAQLARQ